ncbi:MAG: transketolase [Treponema sp.]|nr:transketolase [Treponema sp.]
MAHLASCYSCLEILYALYCKGVLNLDQDSLTRENRDRFILSKGHAGLALYAVLVEQGLLPREEFYSYLKPGCHIGGEPCMRDLALVEASTGSLGHGLSMALGMAIAYKTDKKDARVFVVLGDGEIEEGTVWEAAISARAFMLDNLVVILDANEIQKMDSITNTIKLNNWREKWEAFGWRVLEVDGHDIDALVSVLTERNKTGMPLLIIAHTVKGKGVSVMEHNPAWHFKLPNKKELAVFKKELAITDAELETVCRERI